MSTYNYAENKPIANIDLHGLQAVPFQIIEIKKRFESLASPIKKSIDQISPTSETKARIDMFAGGAETFGFGVVGTVGAMALIPETGFVSGLAIPFTLGEASIGLAAMVDAFKSDASPNSMIHKRGSLIGLVSDKANLNNNTVQVVDAIGQFIPGMLSGGNIIGGLTDLSGAMKSFGNLDIKNGVYQSLQAYDAYSDTKGVIEAANETTKTYVGKDFMTIQASGGAITDDQIKAIKEFLYE